MTGLGTRFARAVGWAVQRAYLHCTTPQVRVSTVRRSCLLTVLLLPVIPAAAQEPPRAAVTGGVGVSYGGLGVLGELHIKHSPTSVLVGAGGVPGWAFAGASAGLRAYSGRGPNRLYVEAMGAYLISPSGAETDVYGPAILIGYAHIASRGVTFNSAIGGGRRADNKAGVALNIGVGFTWHQRARSSKSSDTDGSTSLGGGDRI